MRISERFQFTVQSISDVGNVQGSNRGNHFGALLTNLLKAFDCNDHKLQIAKLYGYGNSSPALNIICSYLKNRNKINDCCSARSNIEYGVPQGSIWVHYFLILIWLTYFVNAKKMILQAMLTTQLPIHVPPTCRALSFLN